MAQIKTRDTSSSTPAAAAASPGSEFSSQNFSREDLRQEFSQRRGRGPREEMLVAQLSPAELKPALDLTRMALERIYLSPAAHRTVGQAITTGGGGGIMRMLGPAGALLSIPLSAERTARDMPSEIAVDGYVGAVKTGDIAKVQIGLLGVANAKDKVNGDPRELNRIPSGAWNEAVKLNLRLESVTERFPGQQFEISQGSDNQGKTYLSLKRGNTVIPLLKNDEVVDWRGKGNLPVINISPAQSPSQAGASPRPVVTPQPALPRPERQGPLNEPPSSYNPYPPVEPIKLAPVSNLAQVRETARYQQELLDKAWSVAQRYPLGREFSTLQKPSINVERFGDGGAELYRAESYETATRRIFNAAQDGARRFNANPQNTASDTVRVVFEREVDLGRGIRVNVPTVFQGSLSALARHTEGQQGADGQYKSPVIALHKVGDLEGRVWRARQANAMQDDFNVVNENAKKSPTSLAGATPSLVVPITVRSSDVTSIDALERARLATAQKAVEANKSQDRTTRTFLVDVPVPDKNNLAVFVPQVVALTRDQARTLTQQGQLRQDHFSLSGVSPDWLNEGTAPLNPTPNEINTGAPVTQPYTDAGIKRPPEIPTRTLPGEVPPALQPRPEITPRTPPSELEEKDFPTIPPEVTPKVPGRKVTEPTPPPQEVPRPGREVPLTPSQVPEETPAPVPRPEAIPSQHPDHGLSPSRLEELPDQAPGTSSPYSPTASISPEEKKQALTPTQESLEKAVREFTQHETLEARGKELLRTNSIPAEPKIHEALTHPSGADTASKFTKLSEVLSDISEQLGKRTLKGEQVTAEDLKKAGELLVQRMELSPQLIKGLLRSAQAKDADPEATRVAVEKTGYGASNFDEATKLKERQLYQDLSSARGAGDRNKVTESYQKIEKFYLELNKKVQSDLINSGDFLSQFAVRTVILEQAIKEKGTNPAAKDQFRDPASPMLQYRPPSDLLDKVKERFPGLVAEPTPTSKTSATAVDGKVTPETLSQAATEFSKYGTIYDRGKTISEYNKVPQEASLHESLMHPSGPGSASGFTAVSEKFAEVTEGLCEKAADQRITEEDIRKAAEGFYTSAQKEHVTLDKELDLHQKANRPADGIRNALLQKGFGANHFDTSTQTRERELYDGLAQAQRAGDPSAISGSMDQIRKFHHELVDRVISDIAKPGGIPSQLATRIVVLEHMAKESGLGIDDIMDSLDDGGASFLKVAPPADLDKKTAERFPGLSQNR